MSLYLIIAAAIFAVNAAVTFNSKKVSNLQTLITLILFLPVWFAASMPLAGLGLQLLSGVGVYFLGLLIRKHIGGGVIRAFALAALWIPGIGSYLNFFVLATIAGTTIGWVIAKIQKSKDIDHYAAIALVSCAVILLFDYSKLPASESKTTAKAAVHQSDIPVLRGLSDSR